MSGFRLVCVERRTGVYAVNVLLGALDATHPDLDVDTRFAAGADAVAAALDDLGPDQRALVVWSFYSADLPVAAADLAAVRQRVDDLRVTHVAGGVHAAAEPARTLAAGWDLVATGEGERTFPALVHALATGTPLAEVPGLGWLDGDGAYVTSGPAPRAELLDDWPPWSVRHGRYNPIELTRGCIYGCRFCQTPFLFRARFRHRTTPVVAEHVRHLRALGLRYVRFITPTALSFGSDGPDPDLDAVEALLAACREAIGPDGKVYLGSFPSEIRPERVTPEALAILKRWVDNTSIIVGAQSGSDAVLAGANRGHGVAEVERAVRVAVAAGFRPDVDLLFGLPGEGPEEAAASVRLAERLADLGARIHSHTFMPLPGTPFRGAAPGRVDDATRLDLERLAGRGALYGQWKAQEDRAARLVPLVRRN